MPCRVSRGKAANGRLAGYTLTEILIVLVVIGLISAVMMPQLMGQLGRSKARTAKLQAQSLAAAVETFSADTGRYPTNEEGLVALVQQPPSSEGWMGPYIRTAEQLRDPWGRPCVYFAPAEFGAGFRVGSLGSDAKEGGEGDARDILVG